MLPNCCRVAFVLFCASGAGAAWGAETPLGAIPDDVAFVLRLKTPDESIEKLAVLLDEMDPSHFVPETQRNSDEPTWGASFRLLAEGIGALIANSALDGVDRARDWWIFGSSSPFDEFVGMPPEGEAKYAFAIPATDAAAMQAAIARECPTYLAVSHNKWLIYGDALWIEKVKSCLGSKDRSLSTRINTSSMRILEQGDASVFLNVPVLAKTWVPLLRAMKDGIRDSVNGLKWLKRMSPPSVGKFVAELPVQFVEFVAQTLSDIDGLAAAIEITAEEVRFEDYVHVKADSPTDAFLRLNPGSDMRALSALPENAAVYIGFHANQKAIASWITEATKMLAAEAPSAATSEWAAIRAGYQELDFGTMAFAFPLQPIDQGPFRVVSITEVDRPQRARELAKKSSELPAFGPEPPPEIRKTITRSTEKYGERSADVVTFPSPLQIAVNGVAQDLMRPILGPDGCVARSVYLDNLIIDTFGGTRLGMASVVRRAIEFEKKDEQELPAFRNVRDKLCEKANLVVLVDPCFMAATGMKWWNDTVDSWIKSARDGSDAQKNNPAPADEDEPDDADGDDERSLEQRIETWNKEKIENWMIEPVERARSYVGVSLALEPQASRLCVVVPREMLRVSILVGEAMGMAQERFFQHPLTDIFFQMFEAE